MAILKIKCPNCSGPMWEEDLPDARAAGRIELACIICGLRKFFDRRKYLAKRQEIEDRVSGKTRPAAWRVVRTRR